MAQQKQQNQNQKENQPKQEKEPTAAVGGASVDVDRHDLCDDVCDDDLEKYRDARLEDSLC